MTTKIKIGPKTALLKKLSDKSHSLVKSFFKNFILEPDDYFAHENWNEPLWKNEIYFHEKFFDPFAVEISSKKEIEAFEKFLKKLKEYKILKKWTTRKLRLQEIDKIFHLSDDEKSLYKNNEFIAFEFKILLANGSDKRDFLHKFFDLHIAEPKFELYSDFKQCRIIAEYAFKKITSFNKLEVPLNLCTLDNTSQEYIFFTRDHHDDSAYLPQKDLKHIKVMRALRILEHFKYLKITDAFYLNNEPHVIHINLSSGQYQKLMRFINRKINLSGEPNNQLSKKQKIFISKNKGVYVDEKLKYPIKKGTKRTKLVWSLKDSEQDLPFLCNLLEQPDRSVIEAIKKINKLFRACLKSFMLK